MSPVTPYILEPHQHQLDLFNKKLYRASIPLTALFILMNELFLRSDLPQYAATPENLWSLFVLTLNAMIPYDQGLIVRLFLASILLPIYPIVFMKLPMWGLRPIKRGLKSGLPNYEDYGKAYFFIENKGEQLAFWLWHSLLMRVSLFVGCFVLLILFNLLRNKFS